MSFKDHYFTLANGNKISPVGFGTGTKWYKGPGNKPFVQATSDAVYQALQNKQYHIDGAEVYNTHDEIAAALKKFFTDHPDVKREDLWITDKFYPGNISPLKSVNESLKTLGIGYVDLYLIHTPFLKDVARSDNISLKQVWQEIEQLLEEGKVKNVGVSNFRVSDLKELFSFAKHRPVVNQIEFSLILQDQSPEIVEFCQQNNILVAAYSPLAPIYKASDEAHTKLQDKLQELATKYNKTKAQIVLRWNNQNGILSITTSEKPHRIVESMNIFDFKLTDDEFNELKKLGAESPQVQQYWPGYYRLAKK